MSKLRELKVERARAGEAVLRMQRTAASREFTADERQQWDRANAAFDRLGAEIGEHERTATARRAIDQRGRPAPGLDDGGSGSRRGRRETAKQIARAHDLAFAGWFKARAGRATSDAERRAAKQVGLAGRKALEIRLGKRPGAEYRALSVGTASAGGNLVPTGFVTAFEKAMAAFGGVRQVADILRTDSGNPLPWPTANDTGNTGELLAENADAADAGADPTFGQTTFGAYKYSSKVIRVSYELVEDSAFDMTATIGEMCGERIGRVQAPHLATGAGTGQPQGVVTGSSLGKTAASASAISFDEVIDLYHSVNPAYRNDPSFAWLMNDATLAVLRKLKDGQGNYLWQMGNVQVGTPETILGKPVCIDLSMPTIAASAKPIVAGPLKKFKVRDVNKVRLKVLSERYAEKDQIGFLAFLRTDAKVLNAGTGPIKHLVMAAS